ncbi:hypothetical protein F6455_01505 [Proteobacteria bacterium 005FR1]|nr:hypothetical protein [Proteobacteria bacterium 005FR1]
MNKRFQFPAVLYKAFRSRGHAEMFRRGSIRFSTLEYYRQTADGARSDQTEGIGVIHRDAEPNRPSAAERVECTPGGIEKLRIEAPDRECFVCCFSLADQSGIDQLPSRFGRFYVEVRSPETLFYQLRDAIRRDRALAENPPALEAGAVRYDKGRYVGALTDPEEIRSLPWLQKPAFYAAENEYRLHFHCRGTGLSSHSHIVHVGQQLHYCRLLER